MAPPLNRTWFDQLIDDDGSGNTGTVWNKTQVDGLMDTIDASLAGLVPTSDANYARRDQANTFAAPNTFNSVTTYFTAAIPSLTLRDTNSAVDQKVFRIYVSAGRLIIDHTNDAISGITSTPLIINADGTIYLAHGALQFPTTQIPRADPNTLDDYREVSFTPSFSSPGGQSGQIYTTQQGRAVKIGRQVAAQGRVTLSTRGTLSGSIRIGPLPFPNTTQTFASAAIGYFSNFAAPIMCVVGAMDPGSSQLALWYVPVGGTGTMLPVDQTLFTNAADVVFAVTYLTD